MTDLFITFLNMSITGAYVILAVLLARLCLKAMPKKYSYLLWSVVGFRLCCPFSFKSVVSMFNLKPFDMTKAQSSSGASLDYVKTASESVSVGIPSVNTVITETTATPVYQENINWLLIVATTIWVVGIVAFVIYSLVSFIKLNKALSTAIKIDDRIYKSDKITSPFIIGIVKPKIYIPSDVENEYLEYVIAHEKHHIKRFDNGVKLISFVLLALHWYNPFCWLAFYLVNKDMEMSCDEYVLGKNKGIKKAYSSALLSFATDKSFPAPSPVFFSESGVKTRIRNVLKYKKPKKILSAIAIVLSLSLLVACAANPSQAVDEDDFADVTNALMYNKNRYTLGSEIGAVYYLSSIGDPNRYDSIMLRNELESLDISLSSGNNLSLKSEYQTDMTFENQSITVLYPKNENHFEYTIHDDYLYLFDDADKIFVNVYYTDDGEMFKIFSLNEKPFAFGDKHSIYRLEAPNFNDVISEAIVKASNLDNAEYVAENHEILQITDGDAKGRNKDKYETVYAFGVVSQFEYKGKSITNIQNKDSVFRIVLEKRDNLLGYKEYEMLNNDDVDIDGENLDYLSSERNIVEMLKVAYGELDFIYSSLNAHEEIENAFNDLSKLKLDEISLKDSSYQILIYLDDLTLDYICNEFNFDGYIVEPHRAEIYRLVMEKLLDLENIKVNINFNAYQYYDAIYEHFLNELKNLGPEDMKTIYPKGYRILENDGNVTQFFHATAHWKIKFEDGKAIAYDPTPERLQFKWADQRGRKIESANIVVVVNDKAVVYEPIDIIAIDQEGGAWDYIGETKTSYTFDAKEGDKIEVLGEFTDNFGMNYRVYLTPTEENTEDDRSSTIKATFIDGNMGG